MRHRSSLKNRLAAMPNERRILGSHQKNVSYACAKSSSKCTKKCVLLFLVTTLALVVPYRYGREILRKLGTDNVLTNTSTHHIPPLDFVNVKKMQYPSKQITPLDPAHNFSFVHISKCAGSTWIRLFKKILKLNICPEHEAGQEYTVTYQQKYGCKDADYTLISLRSPRHHVWSQFTMCKYSTWGKNITRNNKDFPRSGDKYEDDDVDFDSWLGHFVLMGNETHNHYQCYNPVNFQTRALTSERRYVHDGNGGFNPNMALAMNRQKDFDFVALVEFVHESQCMLFYRLGNNAPPAAISYLSKSCHCGEEYEEHQKNGTVHVQHHNMGKRSSLRDLPPATLSKVEILTLADSFIYVNALKNFMDEMAWLESDDALGRRVVCDNALKKWELELAYLDGGHFNVTKLYRNAVIKKQQQQ